MAENSFPSAADIREMNEGQIQAELDGHRQAMFNLRFQLATRKLKNHQGIRTRRRQIARLLTVMREREIEALYAAEIAELQALNTSIGAMEKNG